MRHVFFIPNQEWEDNFPGEFVPGCKYIAFLNPDKRTRLAILTPDGFIWRYPGVYHLKGMYKLERVKV